MKRQFFWGLSRWPDFAQLAQPEAAQDYFLHSFMPDAPKITRQSSITAFGSCFAGHMSRFLHAKGYRVNAHDWSHNTSDLVRINELLVHTPALRAQFEWAFLGTPLGPIAAPSQAGGIETYHENEDARRIISNSDVYIVTFGLTEAWYDRQDARFFWKFVPRKSLDSSRYVNRTIPFQDNYDNIERIYSLIRAHRPEAQIVFTLSPIPLLGTYSGKPIIAANEASKARLRAALDEVLTAHQEDENFFYFPSYELVKYYLHDPWRDDFRHVKPEAVAQIVELFEARFCVRDEGAAL